MNQKMRITYSALVVESDDKHAQYIKAIIERKFDNIKVYIVQGPDAGFNLLKYTSIDMFIIDPNLKGTKSSGIRFATEILSKSFLTQIIFQTHINDLQFQAQLHNKFGHSPYIRKSALNFEEKLVNRVRYALSFVSKHDPRRLVLKKKSRSFCFDIREIIYVFKMPNERTIVVNHFNYLTHEIASTFVPNIGLADVINSLQVKQDLIRIQDCYLINPAMVQVINHTTGEVEMRDGKTSIGIGKTYRKSVGIILNSLLN